ncbi:hypothetical protein MTO96_036276 [Rhipicephalus appendiculatus]
MVESASTSGASGPRVSEGHLEIVLTFMEQHPQLVSRAIELGLNFTLAEWRRLWQHLADALNAKGPAHKKVEMWQECWRKQVHDARHNTAAEVQRYSIVDHMYHFQYITVGAPGRCHDADMYARSQLSSMFDGGYFKLPVALIEGVEVEPITLCDQAFPLMTNLLKPFPNALLNTQQATFNYNLSRTRRIVENAFGRLKARFRWACYFIRNSHGFVEALTDLFSLWWDMFAGDRVPLQMQGQKGF